MAARARAAGAEIREGAAAGAVEPRAGAVRVHLEAGGFLDADRAILCAGPWSAGLLAALGLPVPLTVTRQEYVHLAVSPGSRELFGPSRFPIWIDFPANYYGFPEHDDIPGAKLACHDLGPRVDPDQVDRSPDAALHERLRSYARERLPGLLPGITYRKVCLYDSTPDEDFLLGRLPEEPRIVVACGTSGHGFKFLPLLGRLAATLCEDGELPPGTEARFSLTKAAPA